MNISGANGAPIVNRAGSPGERGTVELPKQGIRHESAVPPIPVWERMDSDKPMMESHGDLIDRVSVMFDPISSIGKEILRLLRDPLWRTTNVLERPPKLAGPLPRKGKKVSGTFFLD